MVKEILSIVFKRFQRKKKMFSIEVEDASMNKEIETIRNYEGIIEDPTSIKMEKLYQNIRGVANELRQENELKEKGIVFSSREIEKWYSKNIKKYEEIISNAEKEVGLKSVCTKGCSACCMQAIYINPVEYAVIEKYIEQIGYYKRDILRNKVKEALCILKQVEVPMKTLDDRQEEIDRINELFFSCHIRCPLLSEENECMIYEVRPSICWTYRNYQNKHECENTFKPRHSCAFVDLDLVMTKEMYVYGEKLMKHGEYYLIIYALGKMLHLIG